MHVVRSSFTDSSMKRGPSHRPTTPSHSGSSVTVSTGLSLGVRVLEAPGLHGSDEEVLTAERLVVESVAVARAAPVQVPVDVESLAAPSTWRMLSQWLPVWHCPRGALLLPLSISTCPCPSSATGLKP